MESLVQRVHTVWRQLKNRFRWTIVDDEDSFLAAIVRTIDARAEPELIKDSEIVALVQQRYNRHLHDTIVRGRAQLDNDALVADMERACQEVYENAWRQIKAKSYEDDVAAELAQKVVMLLIENPYAVREPGSLSVWITWKIKAFLKERNSRRKELSLDPADEQTEMPIAAPHDPISGVEDSLFAAHVLSTLPTILSPFQLQVIQRVVLDGCSFNEVADALGVKDTQVRVEKSRALRKIRQYFNV